MEKLINKNLENIELDKERLYNQNKKLKTCINIISLIIIYSIISYSFENDNRYYKGKTEKMKSLLKGKEYFDICMNGKLLNNITFKKSDNPDISVVIPAYKCQDVIKGVIRSIQNQKLTNIEIILVNDFSPDNTENILKELQKEDERIIIINNNQNRGTLYSRCIGVLATKGKYIFTIDNDDLFFDETVFDEIYKEALKGDFDIIGFKGLSQGNYQINTERIFYTVYSDHRDKLTLFQPELSQFPRKRNGKYGVYDCYLWGKIIKGSKYIKTVNVMGEKIYSHRIMWGEDLITSFVLYRNVQSYRFISKHGLFHYENGRTATYTTTKERLYTSIVIYLDVVFNLTNNDIEDKKYITFVVLDYFTSKETVACLNEDIKKYLNSMLNKILKSEYILDKDKKKLRKHFKQFEDVGIKLD